MDVLMPQLGETVAEGKISKWFVSAGDAVKPGDNLFEIETDKVSMEVPAIAAGTLAAIHVQAGDVAPVGAVVAVILGKGETAAPLPPKAPLTPAQQARSAVQERPGGPEPRTGSPLARGRAETAVAAVPMEPFREVRSPERNFGPARLAGGTTVTPLARRLAGEAGIDLANVKGSGPHGRIVAADVERRARRRRRPLLRASAALRSDTRYSHGRCRNRPVARAVQRGKCRAEDRARTRRCHRQGLGDGACARHAVRAHRRHRSGVRQEPRPRMAAMLRAKSLTAISAARREGAGGKRIERDLDSGRRGNHVRRRRASIRRRPRCSASARRAARRSKRRTARSQFVEHDDGDAVVRSPRGRRRARRRTARSLQGIRRTAGDDDRLTCGRGT